MARKSYMICDICKSDKDVKFVGDTCVVFVTEQNEGRSTDPYIELIELDLCKVCEKYMIDNREMPTATGAMGYNKYYFTKATTKTGG